MKTILRLLAILLSLAALMPVARPADDDDNSPAETGTPATPMVLKFSDPSKPGTVKFRVMWGDVIATAADTQEVTITANVSRKSAPATRSDGLRRLDSEVTYSASEKDNVITVDAG